jgi:teichuronic acid biosynthesis glycosyltransferase TuaC
VKILVIAQMYISPSNINDVVVHQLVTELHKLGCELKVVSPIPWTPFPMKYLSAKWRGYSKVPPKITLDDIEIYYPRFLQFPKSIFLDSSGKRMYSGINKLVDEIHHDFKFDIIHAHYALTDGFAAMLIGNKYNVPLITTPRGTDIDVNLWKNRACFNTICTVLKNSSKVIAPSAQLKTKLLEKINIDAELIPNGIYSENVFTGKSQLSEKYRGRIILLSVGQLIPSKGIDLNLQALALLKNKYPLLHYLIIGEGDLKEKLIQMTSDLGIETSVEFLGRLPHEKVMEYMSICDIFCLPSWQETMGLVYLEAMAHGKPIIGCKQQGVDGLIVNEESGIMVNPQDMESLVQAIEFLINNPDKARTIGENARKLVLENYTWAKNAGKLLDIYRDIIKYDK